MKKESKKQISIMIAIVIGILVLVLAAAFSISSVSNREENNNIQQEVVSDTIKLSYNCDTSYLKSYIVYDRVYNTVSTITSPKSPEEVLKQCYLLASDDSYLIITECINESNTNFEIYPCIPEADSILQMTDQPLKYTNEYWLHVALHGSLPETAQ